MNSYSDAMAPPPSAWPSSKAVENERDTARPAAGTPRPLVLPNMRGKAPSRDAASGTWPSSNIQPLRAASDDATTAIPITLPAHGPHMLVAASAKGADESA